MILAISFLILIFLLGSRGFACLWLLSIVKKPPDPPNQGASRQRQLSLLELCSQVVSSRIDQHVVQFFGSHQPVRNSIKYPPTVFSCSIFIVLQTLPRNKVFFSLFSSKLFHLFLLSSSHYL